MTSKMKIGFHVSIEGSIDKALDRADSLGCTTFQIFTRNPRGWNYQPLKPDEVESFKEKMRRYKITPVFAHMPYLPNLASSRSKVYDQSVRSLIAELNRCVKLGIPYLVTHLGSHLGSGKTSGLKRIIEALNRSLVEDVEKVKILLENTAGTRNSMGSYFEDIHRIIKGVKKSNLIGVCFDTCHAFAAGYDLRTTEAISQVIDHFDTIIGFDQVHLVHLNDSKGGLRSRIDRHEHIGMGRIGEEGFKNILHSELGKLSLILETPVDGRRGDIENLEKAIELAQ